MQRYLLPATAALMGTVAFGFRFLATRDFTNDHFMHLAWARQILLGEVPGRDFVDPGYPLTYGLSALAQLALPGPLSELVLCLAALSVATAALVIVVERLVGSMLAAVAAGLLSVALQPQLYNYPKVLAPAIALLLLGWHETRPSRTRRAALAAWTTASFLFRPDLGLYVSAATGAGLLIANWRAPRTAARIVAEYVAIGLLTVLPYLLFLQWAQGLQESVRVAIEFSKGESVPQYFAMPAFPFLRSWSPQDWTVTDSTAFLFYVTRLLAPVAAVLLVARRHAQRPGGVAVMSAALVLLAAYQVVILRHPLTARLRDLAVPVTVVGVWAGAEIVRAAAGTAWPARLRQAFAVSCVSAVAAVASTSVWTLTQVGERIGATRVLDGPAGIRASSNALFARVRTWPWPRFWPTGPQPSAVRYIATCTDPSARLLMTWSAPEYYFFTRRAFAAGHALLPAGAFVGPADQALTVSRLLQEWAPIALINETRRREFGEAYGTVDAFLVEHYTTVGRYRNYDGADIEIAIRNDVKGSASFGEEGWPCGLEPAPRPVRRPVPTP